MKTILLSAIQLFCFASLFAQSTLSGFVIEQKSQEHIPSVIIKIRDSEIFVTANEYGFYSITLDNGSYTFDVYAPGYQSIGYTVELNGNIEYNFELYGQEALEGVEVIANKSKAQDTRMSIHQLDIQDIQSVPSLLGEKDVFKVIKLLPGVQKGQEGSSGFNVRGGGTDQNLIILDDAVVYNASHLFGFFSTFNGDALKGVELIKGGYPAKYGERLSSVLNITMKEGNKKYYTGEFGIGLLSSRATIEGPIVKDKASFLVSGRRTYGDLFLQPFLLAQEDVMAGYYFSDLNAKVNYQINENNGLYLSGYFGRDRFYMTDGLFSGSNQRTSMRFGWGNATGTMRWNHIFNPKLFANLTFNYSNYNMTVNIKDRWQNQTFQTKLISAIDDIGAKYDISYFMHPDNTIKAGYKITRHLFRPNALTLKENGVSDTTLGDARRYISWEQNLYVDDEWKINKNMALNLGVRGSAFTTDDKTYFNIEPRVSTRILINDLTSIKASYTIMNQYMHLLTSTGINLPTDLWVPATARVAPQRAFQYSLGLFKDLEEPNLSFSLEGYYKTMNNIISYVEGASFMELEDPFDPEPETSSTFEDKVTSGEGYSYGAEFMVQKPKGRFHGWLSYTWSKTQYRFDEVNNGEWFYPRIDRRHDLNIVGFYELTPKIRINALFTFATGNPVSLPQYEVNAYGSPSPTGNLLGNNTYYGYGTLYSDRNDFRTEVYHRLDLGIQFIKEKKKGTRTWEISFYNVYNRKNPFFYSIDYNNQTNEQGLYKYTIFPIIPSITYSYKFH